MRLNRNLVAHVQHAAEHDAYRRMERARGVAFGDCVMKGTDNVRKWNEGARRLCIRAHPSDREPNGDDEKQCTLRKNRCVVAEKRRANKALDGRSQRKRGAAGSGTCTHGKNWPKLGSRCRLARRGEAAQPEDCEIDDDSQMCVLSETSRRMRAGAGAARRQKSTLPPPSHMVIEDDETESYDLQEEEAQANFKSHQASRSEPYKAARRPMSALPSLSLIDDDETEPYDSSASTPHGSPWPEVEANQRSPRNSNSRKAPRSAPYKAARRPMSALPSLSLIDDDETEPYDSSASTPHGSPWPEVEANQRSPRNSNSRKARRSASYSTTKAEDLFDASPSGLHQPKGSRHSIERSVPKPDPSRARLASLRHLDKSPDFAMFDDRTPRRSTRPKSTQRIDDTRSAPKSTPRSSAASSQRQSERLRQKEIEEGEKLLAEKTEMLLKGKNSIGHKDTRNLRSGTYYNAAALLKKYGVFGHHNEITLDEFKKKYKKQASFLFHPDKTTQTKEEIEKYPEKYPALTRALKGANEDDIRILFGNLFNAISELKGFFKL
jgi:hypothetical protein